MESCKISADNADKCTKEKNKKEKNICEGDHLTINLKEEEEIS